MAAPETVVPPSPAPAAPAPNNSEGAVWMMASVVTAAAMTFAVRWSSEELHPSVIVFMRAGGGLILALLAWRLFARFRQPLTFTDLKLHAWRGALIGCSTQLGFYTISTMELATATVLFFSAPIFAALLAIPLAGEQIGPRRGLAIAAGFLGVVIVMRPGVMPMNWPAMAAILSSFLFALALLSARGLATKDGALATYISSAVMGLLTALPLAATHWSVPGTGFGLFALGIVVIASLGRNIADIQAYRLAEASVLAPLAYTRIVLIAGGAYLIFGEVPDTWTLAGGTVIVTAALYIARRERLVNRQNR